MKTICSKKQPLLFFLICLTIAVSVLSQIAVLSSVFRPLMFLLWVLLALNVFLIKKRICFNKGSFFRYFLIIYCLFFIYCFIAFLFNNNFSKNNYLRVLFIPLFVVFVAENVATIFDGKALRRIAAVYIVSAFFYALYVHISFFPSLDKWFGSLEYSFGSKNSAAQIWSTSFLLIVFFFQKQSKNKLQKFILICISLYFLFICALSQSRTSLISVVFVSSVCFFLKSKHKVFFLILLLTLLVFVLNYGPTKSIFDHVFFLDKYGADDLDSLSSGRLILIINALSAFYNNPLFGNGVYYVDCSYVSILAESGLIGFVLIESIWGRIVFDSILSFKKGCIYADYLLPLVIFYFIVSLFEGYPPFGPGVTSLVLWFFFGYHNLEQIYLRKKEYNRFVQT